MRLFWLGKKDAGALELDDVPRAAVRGSGERRHPTCMSFHAVRLGEAGRTEVAEQVHAQFPFLDIQTTRRLVRLYGTNAHSVLSEAESVSDLGQHFGCELYQAEVEYLIDNKWAYTAEDILYRRTKLGIVMSEDGVSELQAYLENRALEEINIPRSPQYIYPPLIPSFKRPDLCLS